MNLLEKEEKKHFFQEIQKQAGNMVQKVEALAAKSNTQV